MYRRSLVALATIALLLVLVAPMPVHGLTQGAADGGTLTVLEPGAPDTLDPLLTHTAAGVDATAPVFDSLVRLDATGTFRPDLAMRWHRDAGATTWTFTLDPRARWQDGVPVTASDVAFTLRLVRDARFGASSTLGFTDISAIAISDTHSLTVTLRSTYAPFLALVGTTPILPQHVLGTLAPAAIRDYVPFNRHPIGSGPFVVAEVTSGGQVIEEANKDYFGGAPRLDRLVFTPARSRRAALVAAAHDTATLLPPSLGLTPADLALLPRTRTVSPLYTPSFAWMHLDLIEHGALADARVRRALALATPRAKIIAQALDGHGELCDADQAPGTPAYAPNLRNSYPYDPHAARLLLAQAGYKPRKDGRIALGGKGLPLTVTLWGDSSCSTCATTLKLIAQGWRAVGVSSTIHLVPTATLFGDRGPLYNPRRFQSSTYDAVLYTWVNGPDPDDSAYWTHSALVSPAHPLGGNFSGYNNPHLDELIIDALATPDGPGRYALYRRIQRILVADEPDIFLYWADNLSVVPRSLRGYAPTPYNTAATWNAAQWQL